MPRTGLPMEAVDWVDNAAGIVIALADPLLKRVGHA